MPLLSVMVLAPVPRALKLVTTRLPWLMFTPPVNVLTPLSRHVPVPVLVIDVAAVLLGMMPASSPVPVPWRVRVLAAVLVTVRLDVNFSDPVPLASRIPCVWARAMTRSVVSPGPV